MGTRSITYIHNGNREADVLCAIYRQMDGHPSCAGKEIADILGGKTLVNGMSGNRAEIADSMGCAAAQLISGLKTEAGSIYMTKADAGGEDYDYHIFFDGNQYNPEPGAGISVEVYSYRTSVWTGLLSAFDGDAIEASENEY